MPLVIKSCKRCALAYGRPVNTDMYFELATVGRRRAGSGPIKWSGECARCGEWGWCTQVTDAEYEWLEVSSHPSYHSCEPLWQDSEQYLQPSAEGWEWCP